MRLYDLLFDLPTALLFLISISVAFAISGLALGITRWCRRLWPAATGALMISTTLSATVVPAALMITFIANEVWVADNRAKTVVLREGMAIAESLKLLRHLPSDARPPLQEALLAYARTVVTEDWDAMRAEQRSENTEEAMYLLRERLYEAKRHLPDLEAVWQTLSEQIGIMVENREIRHSIAQLCVSPMKWAILLLLFFVNACAVCELNPVRLREQLVGLVLLSLAFGSISWLILVYDRPFAGTTALHPTLLIETLASGAWH
ncbi:bestrophin-like domain [Noviherbaspirillum pedocola]|uniref:DUF4239 domain-containing protein n=1 Tax=Noviherbaspirillum pedocola TaxID=2801341 RepID=A0A934W5W3_9BURK|nr:DUF4239 domain-containing protein [Noviherbaspirillum pedocola]MBK4733648.1 DUF4239 domain-containing protein [Noviherbaspirillum pedocola]